MTAILDIKCALSVWQALQLVALLVRIEKQTAIRIAASEAKSKSAFRISYINSIFFEIVAATEDESDKLNADKMFDGVPKYFSATFDIL